MAYDQNAADLLRENRTLRDEVAAAHREGVIDGLERALALCPKKNSTTQWYPEDEIRAEIERLKNNKENER